MSLRDQGFPPSLDTSHDEIAKQFYIPALKQSVAYERAVGYFTSDWLRVNAEGMVSFVARGGKAKWIVSPILSREDAKALEDGYEAARDRVLADSLRRTLEDLEIHLSEETRSALAWLIADGFLDFRIALPCSKLSGDFHVKFGIFYDDVGDVVAFDGSQNETARGFDNYESIKIFWNWDPALAVYVESDVHRFARLWHDRDLNVRIHTVPEAVRQQLLRLRTHSRPYSIPDQTESSKQNELRTTDYSGLWQHQRDAIDAWERSGRRGILVMATGSGKTRTGITAISRIPDLRLAIIAVPSRELANQWINAISPLRLERPPLPIMESSQEWFERAYRLLALIKANQVQGPITFVGTYSSLASPKFKGLISRIGLPTSGSLLLADEVHNAAATTHQRVLDVGFEMRLGMTATLERALDPVGTQALLDYFGPVVFEFGIDKAIQAGVLCQYRYYPLFATLSDDELAEYAVISNRIAQILGNSEEPDESGSVSLSSSSEIEQLYFRRAAILKRCSDKLSAIEKLLQTEHLSKALVYCADLDQVSQCEEILKRRGLTWLRFSSLENADTRQRALDLLARGNIQILISVNCLDEGIDVPDVREAIIVASSGNPRQFVQRRGRILRKHPDKKEAILFDILTVPPPLPLFYRSKLLTGELRRATLIARSAINANQAQALLLQELQPFGITAIDVL